MSDIHDEYESACEYMAKRGRKGLPGDPLPMGLSRACLDLINGDPEDFQQRVRDHAYAFAMESLNLPEEAANDAR